MTTTTQTLARLDVPQTAKALREALKAAFPGVKFSVRMDRGTAYGWLSVGWTDGPTYDVVKHVASGFESSRFDGMDDAYHSTGISGYSCRGATCDRHYSAEAEQWARTAVAAHPGRWTYLDDPKDPTDPDYYAVRRLLAQSDLTGITQQ